MTFEQIFSQMADKAMAKRREVAARPPRSRDMWDRLQAQLTDEFKPARVLAEEVGRAYSTVITVLRTHQDQLDWRPLPVSHGIGGARRGKEWRMKGREVGPGRGGVCPQ